MASPKRSKPPAEYVPSAPVGPPARPHFTDFAPGLQKALADAAVPAGQVWALSRNRGHLAAEAGRIATALAACAVAAVDGVEFTLPVPDAALPLRDLLDALRAQFLERLSGDVPPADGADVVRALRGLELVRARIDLDTTQRFANHFAGNDALELIVEVAHDMRSPLASILFLVERLRSGQSGPVSALQERQLGLVYGAAFGLGAMANDTMELARGGERLVDLQPIPFSIGEIMRAVGDILLPVAEEKRLRLVLESPPVDLRVGHAQALNRVLLNLATNALKFTSEGSVTVAARAVSRTRVQFEVSDTGRGIPNEVMATLFDTFRARPGGAPGDYVSSSAGRGLSICRKLVGLMGGEMIVETEIRKGTRFHFELELPPATSY